MGSARRRTNSAGGHHLTGTPVHYSGVNIDIGRSLGEFIPANEMPVHESKLRRKLEGGLATRCEMHIFTKDPRKLTPRHSACRTTLVGLLRMADCAHAIGYLSSQRSSKRQLL